MRAGNRYRSALFSMCAFLSFPVIWSVTAFGEEPAEIEPVIETREVVISATKTPVPVSHLTSAVEVIRGEELEQKKIKMVVDALRLAQGMAVFSNGGPGTSASVRIRGASDTHTLVLIDGVIVNSPTLGSYDFANLTTENIERIEILRGAQSMLYGSDAMGGVINIITKKGSGVPTANAFMEYGSFASLREGGQVSGAKGPVDFSMSLSRWDTSSFSAANYRRGATERDGFHNWQASARLGFALPKDGRLDFTMRWYNADVNTDDTNRDVFGSKNSTNNLILSGSYEQPLTNWWSQKLTVAQADERDNFVSGPVQKDLQTGIVGPAFAFTSSIGVLNRRVEWQHNFQVAKPLLITAGYQFREEQGDNADIAPSSKRIASNAGFAQAQVNVFDRLFVTGGVRQDSYNVFSDATTYRTTAGILVPETGTKFRGSYATGYRAPTINQLFFPGFGNPNLKPEKSQSMDAGIDQSLFGDRLQLSAGYFWNHFNDLIQTLCDPSFFACVANNVSQVRTQGWELGFKYAVMEGLALRGQYTYTLTRVISGLDLTGGVLDGRRLPRWPIDQASLGFTYQPIQPVRVNLDYRFVGARNNNANNDPGQKSGSFGVINISATYDVTNQWQVYGRIDNLFNQRYEEILTFGTPIRSIYGGVKFTY